jgi:hypothetical protein
MNRSLFIMPRRAVRAACVYLLAATTSVSAAPILVDFGITNRLTASPDHQGHYWNNVFTSISDVPTSGIPNLVTISNALSGVGLSVQGFGAGANPFGSTVPAATLGRLAVTNALRDSFFVATGDTARVVLTGLQTSMTYRIECTASRDAADTRVTIYRAAGANSTSATVQTSGSGIGAPPEPNGNNSFLAVLDEVQPTVSGVVTLFVSVAQGPFGYIGALQIVPSGGASPPSNAPPTAAGVIWVGAPVAGRPVTVHYAYSDDDGDPESDTQIFWQIDTPPFTNSFVQSSGTNRTWVVPNETGAYLRAIVEPRAASGASNGVWAYSAWRGPIAPSNATAVFHIGNSFTRWGNIPLQLQQLASDAGRAHARGAQLTDGMGLGYHWTNGLFGGFMTTGTPARLELATATWDWLILQPHSREWQPANLPAFVTHASLFAGLAASNGARVALYQYWNYLDETASDQIAINAAFEAVRAALASNGIDAVIIPAGQTFSQAVANVASLTKPDLYQDNIHPSDIGYYLSALAHYAVVYAHSPVGLTNGAISANATNDDPVVIPSGLATALQAVVWDTVRHHPRTAVTARRFEAWAASLPPGGRGWEDAPFADGVPNVIRWAHGLPQADGAGSDRLPRPTSDGPRLRYRLGADAEDAALQIQDEWSTDLLHGHWSLHNPPGFNVSRSGDLIEWTLGGIWSNVFHRLRYAAPRD